MHTVYFFIGRVPSVTLLLYTATFYSTNHCCPQAEERKDDAVRRKEAAKNLADRARAFNARFLPKSGRTSSSLPRSNGVRSRSVPGHTRSNAGGNPPGDSAGRRPGVPREVNAEGITGGAGRGGRGGRGGLSRALSSPPRREPHWDPDRLEVGSAAATAAGFRVRGDGHGDARGYVDFGEGRGRVRGQATVGARSGCGVKGRSGSGLRAGFGSGAASTRGAPRPRSGSRQRRVGETVRVDGVSGDGGGDGGGVGGVSGGGGAVSGIGVGVGGVRGGGGCGGIGVGGISVGVRVGDYGDSGIGVAGAGGVGAGGGGGGGNRGRDPSHPHPHRPSRSSSTHLVEPGLRRTCVGEPQEPSLTRGVLGAGTGNDGRGRGTGERERERGRGHTAGAGRPFIR